MPSEVAIEVDHIWKKFRRGELHDSLRDLIPSMVKRLMGRAPNCHELAEREFWALKDVSFQVKRGEALGIIGPNGAGKSTILKILSRILRPTRGEVRVNGRLEALIEVAAGFHPDLTGRENIYLQGSIVGMKRSEIARKFGEILEFSGIGNFIDTPVKRYSSGMYARLGFSIAVHLDPEVLLIDEVLSVGDATFQHRCLEKMNEKLRNGVAVVFVSHNLQAVASVCDSAMVLSMGGKLFHGEPEQALQMYLAATPIASTRYGAQNGRFKLLSVDFHQVGGREGSSMAPHTPCELLAIFECLEDVPPFNVGIEFERTRDMLYCYGATTGELWRRLLEVRRGEVFTMVFRFAAHFARGHYRINLNIRDPARGTFLHYAENAASFTIDEQVSYDGVTDVGLEAGIQPGRACSFPARHV